ncbi:hypothetical protein ACOSP7_005139 [Xanthoceras sorbifolium]
MHYGKSGVTGGHTGKNGNDVQSAKNGNNRAGNVYARGVALTTMDLRSRGLGFEVNNATINKKEILKDVTNKGGKEKETTSNKKIGGKNKGIASNKGLVLREGSCNKLKSTYGGSSQSGKAKIRGAKVETDKTRLMGNELEESYALK